MASTDVELEQQLKEAGKRLAHPPASVDELLPVLDQVEKLLSKVDQSPKKSMLDALKPSMKALIQGSLSRHSEVDVKVAVASCISEITRITAPDAPYNDDQMRDVFQLIVSSFEHLADQSSRSYNKRASILETVSKVRSCVIMLDLECDGLIVEMFEHFLKSVRDHHLESIYLSMENIMVLVLEESEEISAEMLKPLLASVKKDNEGVLPVARKLGEGVLLKSAAKLRPYLIPILKTLGDTLDNYSQVVASICEGTTTVIERNDENASGQQANESKSVKVSLDEAQQADESKLTTASSDHTEQVVKEGPCPEEADLTLDRSPKSVMSNGINVTGNEEASVDQKSSKKPEEAMNELHNNIISKEETEQRKSDSAEPSDSSHVEGEKEAEKQPDAHSSPVKEASTEAVNPSETEKDSNVHVSSPKAIESKAANVSVSSPSQSGSIPDDSLVKKAPRSKRKTMPQQDEVETTKATSPSQSGSLPDETRLKKAGRSKNKGLIQEDTPPAPEGTSESDIKPQKRGKKAVLAKEVKLPATKGESDGEAGSDSDAKPLKKSTKKADVGNSGSKSTKQSGKKVGAGDSEAKKTKQSEAKKVKNTGKKADGEDAEVKTSKQAVKKGEDSDSDAKPLKHSVKKGIETKASKHTVEEKEESDSDAKPIRLSAKKGNTSSAANVKSSSKKKDDGKKGGRGKNVVEKDETKSLSDDDEMDSSPKSETKSAKVEENLKETPATSSKRKRKAGKEKASDTIKYDKSLVGLKVKVWWPEDKMYYEGVIEHFDSSKKKHKVSYVDGDLELLNLRTQKWEILEEFSARDEEQATEVQSPKASPETPKKKKSKTDSAPSASQEKTKDSTKKVSNTPLSSKSKGTSSKSARTPKSEPEADNKSKDTKTSGKSSTDEAAAATDEEPPKTTTKTANKSKGKTPQSGNKSTNGPSKAKSGPSNVKEPDDVKDGKAKSTDTVKNTPESTKGGSKGGKKRKKRT